MDDRVNPNEVIQAAQDALKEAASANHAEQARTREEDDNYLRIIALAEELAIPVSALLRSFAQQIEAGTAHLDGLRSRLMDAEVELELDDFVYGFGILELVNASSFGRNAPRNHPTTEHLRNLAVARVLRTESLSIEQQESFIIFTNRVLAGYVDDFERLGDLPTDTKRRLYASAADAIFDKEAVFLSNLQIIRIAEEGVKRLLYQKIGAHDDIELLADRIIIFCRGQIAEAAIAQINPEIDLSASEDDLRELIEYAREVFGLDEEELYYLVENAATALATMGYTPNL